MVQWGFMLIMAVCLIALACLANKLAREVRELLEKYADIKKHQIIINFEIEGKTVNSNDISEKVEAIVGGYQPPPCPPDIKRSNHS